MFSFIKSQRRYKLTLVIVFSQGRKFESESHFAFSPMLLSLHTVRINAKKAR